MTKMRTNATTVSSSSSSSFIYLFIYFQNLGCNTTTAKAENTIQYMHTWILKDECVATYIAPIKHTMHLINTMSVHGIIWRRVGDARINRTSILSKERNQFSLVYTWSASSSSSSSSIFGWMRSTVGRTPVFGRRTDPVLRLACSWWVTTMWVNRPLLVSQLGQLSLLSFLGR